MVNTPRSANWVLMGRGKTIITLTALKHIRFERCLVIAPPMVAAATWTDEVEKWDHIDFSIGVIQGDPKRRLKLIKQGEQIQCISMFACPWLFKEFGAAKKFPWDIIVIDESNEFGSQSNRWRALKKLTKFVDRVISLTGTPAPDHYDNLWPQFYLLDFGQRLDTAQGRYRSEHFDVLGLPPRTRLVLKSDAREKIINKVKDITHELPEAQIEGLEPIVYRDFKFDLPPTVRNFYEQLAEHLVAEWKGTEVAADNDQVVLNYLAQIASGALYSGELDEADNRIALELHTMKLDMMSQLLSQQQGRPLLVGYYFNHEKPRLERLGGHIFSGHVDEIRAFQAGEIKVFCAHPQSVGHGLNLQYNASDILWFTLPSWRNSRYQQFNHRLQRRGQKHQVYVNHLIAKGTIDEIMFASIARKDRDESRLLDALAGHIRRTHAV